MASGLHDRASEVDRRYKEAQGFSTGGQVQRDALARRIQARTRSQAHVANAYGGSTGGQQSIDSGTGLQVMQQRAQSIAQARQVFKDYGGGALGARKAFAEARVLPD